MKLGIRMLINNKDDIPVSLYHLKICFPFTFPNVDPDEDIFFLDKYEIKVIKVSKLLLKQAIIYRISISLTL